MKTKMTADLMDGMVRDWLANEGYIQAESGEYVRERTVNEAWTDWQDTVISERLTLDGDPFCEDGTWYQTTHDENGKTYALTARNGEIEII